MAEGGAVDVNEDICAICLDENQGCSDNSFVSLTRKGVESLFATSSLNKDEKMQSYLRSNPRRVNVHVACRKAYSSKREFDSNHENEKENVAPKKLRSNCLAFNWKESCFYCGLPAPNDSRHPDRCDRASVSKVSTIDSVLDVCASLWRKSSRCRRTST